MTIGIKKTVLLKEIEAKLKKSEKKGKALMGKKILGLCGILDEKIQENPVTLVRKMHDEEWS